MSAISEVTYACVLPLHPSRSGDSGVSRARPTPPPRLRLAIRLAPIGTGRRVPSLEHLDKLLTTLGAGIEELTYEMRTIQYKAPSAPLVVWPQFLQTQEGAAAGALLTVLLDDLRQLLLAQAEEPAGERPAADSKPVPPVPPMLPKPLPAKAQPTKAPRRKRE